MPIETPSVGRRVIFHVGQLLHRVRTPFGVLFVVSIVLASVIGSGILGFNNKPVIAAPTTNLNFQARLMNASGGLVADGFYNIQFNLYYQASGGSTLWTETYLVSNTQGVRIKNGYFSTNLGSVSSFPGTINWDEELWLGMTVRGTGSCAFGACTPADSEMTPRIKLTAVPYAFKAAMAANVASASTNAASTNSNGVSVVSGNATGATSNSGNITIDSGTATGTAGSLLFGTANASALTIGRTGVTTTLQGSVALNGAGTALSVTNDATIGGTLGVTGVTTATGGLTVGTGSNFINQGSTLNTASAIANLATGGNIGTAAATVDAYTTFNINQTTAGQALTLPTPTNTTAGRIVYVNNVGSASFTMYGTTIGTNGSNAFIWNGAQWITTVSLSGSSVSVVGTIDSQTKSADGAVISGNAIYLQTADTSYAGLVSTGTQTFAGDKTFDDTLTVNGAAPNVADGAALTVDTQLTSSTQSQNGLFINVDVAPTAAGTGEEYVGSNISVVTASSNFTQDDGLAGVSASVGLMHSGTLGGADGVRGFVVNIGGGTTNFANGLVGVAANAGAGTIVNAAGLQVGYLNDGPGSITNGIGIILQETASATNNINLFIGDSTGGTPAGDWNIYSESTLDSVFAGDLSIGSINAPNATLDVTGSALISANLTVDTSTLFVDSTNNFVSIGSTSDLGARLQVVGAADETQLLIRANGTQSMSNPLVLLQNSSGSELARINASTTSLYFGNAAGGSNASGADNVGIGASALGSLSTGSGNTTLGSGALASVSTGENNTAVGRASQINATGNWNTSIGEQSLYGSTGYGNVAVGRWAMQGSGDSSANTVIGSFAGQGISTGDNNILVGYQTGDNITTGSNNIIIGYDLDASAAGVNNELRIGGVLQGSTSTLAAQFNGTLDVVDDLTVGDDSGNIFVVLDSSAAGTATIDFDQNNGTDYIQFDNNTNTFTWKAAGVDQLTVNSSGLTALTGTIAVGTTTQAGSLVISDGSSNTATINVNALAGNYTVSIPTITANDTFCLYTLNNCAGVNYWTDAGTQTYLTSTSDELVVGSSSAFSAKFSIIGTSDQEQLLIRAYSSQTNANPLVVFQSSTGTELARLNVDASNNLTFGYNSLSSASLSGQRNTALGANALQNNTSGSANAAIGYNALRDNVAGSGNFAVGDGALAQNSASSDNIAIGFTAMYNSEGGQRNIALGPNALYNNTGDSNIALGHQALRDNLGGNNNFAVGDGALTENSSGSNNIALGFVSMFASEGGQNNIALGQSSLYSNTGDANLALGQNALYNNTGDMNIALGSYSLQDNTSGAGNIALGNGSLESNTAGDNNIAIGVDALKFGDGGNSAIAIGFSASRSNQADGTIAIGSYALDNVTTGATNIAIGSAALAGITTGSNNTALGQVAGQFLNTTDSNNTLVGAYAGYNMQGSGNTVLGSEAGRYGDFTASNNNVLLGTSAGRVIRGGDNSVLLGYYAGSSLETGDNNILIGYQAGDNLTTGGNNIILGYGVDASAAGASNELRVGNGSNITLQADLSTMAAQFNGALNIQGNLTIGNANTDTITINAGSSGSGITFSDASFQNCVLSTNASGVLTCASSGALITLQSAYQGGNTITATDAEGDIAFTLSEATDFIANITGTGTFQVQDGGVSALTVEADGDIALDTSTLFVDATNNRVGIGDTTPDSILDIEGSTNGDIEVNVTNTSNGGSAFAEFQANNDLGYRAAFGIGSSGTTADVWQSRAYVTSSTSTNGITILTQGAGDDIRFFTGGQITTNERLRVTDSTTSIYNNLAVDTDTLYVDSTNNRVGIGVTPTTAKLQIQTSGLVALQVNQQGAFNIAEFLDNGTVVFAVADGGNVGIKTGTNSIASAYDLTFGDGASRTLGVLTRTTNAAGNNLTISAGSAGSGASAFSGGVLTLQGGSAAGTGNANGGNVVLTGGLGTGTGVRGLVVVDTAAYSASTVQNFTGNANITQSNIDTYGTILISANAAGYTATLTDPTNTTAGRLIYITNTGIYDMTLSVNGGGQGNTVTLKPNTTATMIWNGSDWTAAGASSSTDLQAAYNNTATSAGGAELILNAAGGAADGLTIRNNATTPISGGILEVQSSIGTNLFSVNNFGTELAANGGSETSGTWTTDWTVVGAGSVARTTTAGEFVTGQAGAEVNTPATTNTGIRNNLSGNPVVSTTYTVSFTAKLASGTFSGLQVVYSRDGGTDIETCTNYSSQTLSTSVWTKITCTITTDSTTATNPDLIIRQTDATARNFWIDNLSFVRNDATTQPSNVQIGGGINGGPVTLFTLDRASSPPVANGDSTYYGSMYYDTTTGRIQCYEADGWGACGSAPDNIVVLTPEYAGAVLNGSGVGTMTADFCANQSSISFQVNQTFCSSGLSRQYYRWTSPQANEQTYSIYVSYKLPSTFKEFYDNSTIKLTAYTDSLTNGSVTYEVFRSTGSAITRCNNGTNETTVTTSASTWQTVGINGNEQSCGFAAGENVIFKINVKAKSNANVYVENLEFRYTNL